MSHADHWSEFKFHLMYERRYIPDLRPSSFLIDPRRLLEEALTLVDRIAPAGTALYRARLGGHPSKSTGAMRPYPPKEMGAPPPELARGGRINPAGIPFLYLALSEETAVAEVRPWKGAHVSVARFVLPSNVRIADLTHIPLLKTPFGLEDLKQAVDHRGLLRHLAAEFAKPVAPETPDVEYVPTQYLSEVIRSSGFDGIEYPSALSPDANLVLFEPKHMEAERTWAVEVESVAYSFGPPSRSRTPL